MKFISISATCFKRQVFLVILSILVLGGLANGIILERIVAIIGDSPVFLSEFLEFKRTLSSDESGLQDEEILDRLIDRKLLLMEARRLRLDATGGGNKDPDVLIDLYLQLAVRAFMPASRVKKRLPGGLADSPLAQDEEFNRRLREKIMDLRKQYDIRLYTEM